MKYRVISLFASMFCLVALWLCSGCDRSETPTAPPPPAGGGTAPKAEAKPAAEQTIDLTFTYGSEKEKWIKKMTEAFNASGQKIASGKRIVVNAIPMGSGESIDELLAGRRQAHLTSPASAAFVKLGNAQSRAKMGQDLIGPTDNLVLSPVVIAMWKPMAEALGYGQKPIGWGEILSLAKDPQGWGTLGHGEWGRFKFGHTHPEYSNSGLIAVMAEAYAGAGKVSGLSLEDLSNPKTTRFIQDIEQAVVHYGSSTGFFGRKMYANGPTYLSAAVLYENMVIESYDMVDKMPFPIVAIYPREGTFWSDHPIGIVQRDWVTPEHKEAAQSYIKYLLDKPQQQAAMEFGFRPADPSIALAAPIDQAHGVDPKQPQTTLEVPSAEVANAVIQTWRENKKHANVVLVLDRSGSMNENNKMNGAKAGAGEMLNMLGDQDQLSFLPFSSEMNWVGKGMVMKTDRQTAGNAIQGTFAEGGTKLYDSIAAAYDYLASNPTPTRISAIVVLTDGEDTASQMKLEQLLAKIKPDEEKRPIRVFTIGYGPDAKKEILGKIAETTQAKFYQGTPENIREVFKDIATFF